MALEVRSGALEERERVVLFHVNRLVYDPLTRSVPAVTVTVITKNEADALADALKSVSWADELIVIDAVSTVDSVKFAWQFTDRLFVWPWYGYLDQYIQGDVLST